MPLELTPQKPPYYQPATGTGSSMKVYKAILNQTGTAAPIETTLIDTIGFTTWIRDSLGTYHNESTEPLVTLKTWMQGQGRGGANSTIITLTNLSAITGYISIRWDGGTNNLLTLTIETYNAAWASADLGSLLTNLSLPEINVFT